MSRCAIVLLAAFCAGRIVAQEPPAVLPERPTVADLETPVPPPSEAAPPKSPDGLFNDGAMGGFGAGGGGGMGGGRQPFSYRVTWYDERPVSAQATHLGWVRQEVSGMMPVWGNGRDMVMVNASVRNTLYQTDALLPDSGRAFPRQIWGISLGTNRIHRFDNGWTGMAMVTLGSTSDRPFASINEMNLGVMAFLRIPREFGAWQIGLMYSPLGELPFPIPMVSYQWRPSDQWSVNIGIPFQVTWRPDDDWTLSLMYAPVRTVNAQPRNRLTDDMQVYGGFNWGSEQAFLADRTDLQERFQYFEKKLSVGWQWNATKRLGLDVSGGYSFDRFFFAGRQYQDRNHDRVNVGAGVFVSAQLGFRF